MPDSSGGMLVGVSGGGVVGSGIDGGAARAEVASGSGASSLFGIMDELIGGVVGAGEVVGSVGVTWPLLRVEPSLDEIGAPLPTIVGGADGWPLMLAII